MSTVLRLSGLGERHPGVTNALGDAYAEAASVCMSQHHQSPIEVAAHYKKSESNCVLPLD
jgi:hypothetical protein